MVAEGAIQPRPCACNRLTNAPALRRSDPAAPVATSDTVTVFKAAPGRKLAQRIETDQTGQRVTAMVLKQEVSCAYYRIE